MPQEFHYEDRYCAYIDILGFRQMLTALRNGGITLEQVQKALWWVHHPQTMIDHNYEGSDFKAQSISDAVVISTACNEQGIAHLFYAIEQMALILLMRGFLIRGAVVKGLLFHEDQTVFGDALVEAYRLESEVVRYPRVMISSPVYNSAKRSGRWSETDVRSRILESDDGPYFLHILRPLKSVLERELESRTDAEMQDASNTEISGYMRMQERLQANFTKAIDEPSHFEKVKWFAHYWNEFLPDKHDKLKRITGPGMNVVTWRNGSRG